MRNTVSSIEFRMTKIGCPPTTAVALENMNRLQQEIGQGSTLNFYVTPGGEGIVKTKNLARNLSQENEMLHQEYLKKLLSAVRTAIEKRGWFILNNETEVQQG